MEENELLVFEENELELKVSSDFVEELYGYLSRL